MMNKASVHVTQPGNTTGLGDILSAAVASGNPLPVLYGLNAGLKNTINRASPVTKFIYRRQSDAFPRLPGNFYIDDPVQSATNWLTKKRDRADKNRTLIQNWMLNPADWYDPLNEPVIELPPDPTEAQIQDAIRKAQWLNTWMITALDIAAANGLKLALFSFPTGSPPEQVWPYLFPALRRGKQLGAILSLHEYSVLGTMQNPKPGNVLRYRKVYALLPADCRCLMAVTECGAGNGYDTGLSGQAWVDDLMWYNGQACQDDFLLGFCAFQLGGNESNMVSAIPAYTAAIVGFKCSAPPPAESADGTTIPSADRITDNLGNIWTFGATVPMGHIILKNGVQFAGGQGNLLLYWAKRIYTRNANGEWYVASDTWTRTAGDPRTLRVLGVPWVGQNTTRTDDDFTNGDCGTASVCSWLRYRGITVSVDDVSRATGLAAGFKYTSFYDLDRAANKYGLNLKYQLGNMTPAVIKSEIDVGRPCIVLVYYPALPVRWDSAYTFNHWILIAGYNSSGFYYNDPYWPDERGKAIFIDAAQLSVAMANVSINSNVPHQGIVEELSSIGLVAIRSVHGRADGGPLRAIDVQGAKTSPLINGYKLYKNSRDDYAVLRANGFGIENIHVRLDHVTDRRVNADFYINSQNTGIWDLPLKEAAQEGVIWFEMFNEVNLGVEGNGIAWSSPTDFCNLFKQILSLARAKFPSAKFLSPAISPQPDTASWWGAFSTNGVFSAVDGYAAHAYWDSLSGTYPMDSTSGGRHYRGLFPYLVGTKKVHITEASNNAGMDSDISKGQQYAQYLKTIELDRVAWVDFFCISSSDVGDGALFNQRRETWVRGSAISDIPRYVV